MEGPSAPAEGVVPDAEEDEEEDDDDVGAVVAAATGSPDG
jgi:hypothetical protein